MGELINTNTIEILGGIIVALLGLLTAIVEKGRRAAKSAEAAAGVAARSATVTARSVEVVREQVQNSHTTNLREEADERHEENSGKLDVAIEKLDTISKAVQDLRDNDGRLFDLIVGNTKDIREIQKIRKLEREKNDQQ